MSAMKHPCPACEQLGPRPLCLRCEVKYQIYVSLYRPRKTRHEGTRHTHLTKPQTRHQWAAHQKKAKQ
jgi:hypothetical protein